MSILHFALVYIQTLSESDTLWTEIKPNPSHISTFLCSCHAVMSFLFLHFLCSDSTCNSNQLSSNWPTF